MQFSSLIGLGTSTEARFRRIYFHLAGLIANAEKCRQAADFVGGEAARSADRDSPAPRLRGEE